MVTGGKCVPITPLSQVMSRALRLFFSRFGHHLRRTILAAHGNCDWCLPNSENYWRYHQTSRVFKHFGIAGYIGFKRRLRWFIWFCEFVSVSVPARCREQGQFDDWFSQWNIIWLRTMEKVSMVRRKTCLLAFLGIPQEILKLGFLIQLARRKNWFYPGNNSRACSVLDSKCFCTRWCWWDNAPSRWRNRDENQCCTGRNEPVSLSLWNGICPKAPPELENVGSRIAIVFVIVQAILRRLLYDVAL